MILAACSGKQSSGSPSPTSTTTGLLNEIPSLSVASSPTMSPLELDDSDPRFPIEAAFTTVGQTLYEAHCGSCHGMDGKGQYPDDPYKINDQGLAGAPPHDASGHTWHHPDQSLVATIYDGQSLPNFQPMPAFGNQLNLEEIFQIIAYIKTWWGPDELASQRELTTARMSGQ